MNLAKIAGDAALRAIKAYGAPATLTHTVPGAYDPATGTNAAGTTTNCNTSAVLDSTAKNLGYLFDASLVQGGDLMAMIPAKGLTFDPDPGCTLTFTGWAFVVLQAKPTFAGAVPVVWQLLVRK